MKITIDISEVVIQRLGTWASVSRTLNESKRIINEQDDLLAHNNIARPDGLEIDTVLHNINELTSLNYSLDTVHQLIRTEIWELERKGEITLKRPRV